MNAQKPFNSKKKEKKKERFFNATLSDNDLAKSFIWNVVSPIWQLSKGRALGSVLQDGLRTIENVG